MSNVEYCSFVSEDFIICDCGNSFSDEQSLRSHLELDHFEEKVNQSEDETAPVQNVAVESEESHYGNLYYITDPGSFHFPSGTGGATITIKSEQGEPLATTSAEYISEYYVKEEPETTQDGDEGDYVCQRVYENAHTVTNHEDVNANQNQHKGESPSSRLVSPVCRVVAFKRERTGEQPVILVGRGEEHDYDREIPRTCVATAPPSHPVEPGEFVCELCGKSYGSTRALKIHMRRHVCLPNSQPRAPRKGNGHEVVCDLCGKKYKSNAALRYHTRVHTGEKPYQCVYCPKAFTMPLFLQLHIRTHTGERPFPCDLCDKRFSNKPALVLHIRTHTGERPYPCNLCEKRFSNKAALARHDRVHTGEKPYECQFCRKSFTQSNSMKLHITTVHLKLPSPYKSHSRAERQRKRLEALQALGRAPPRTQRVVRVGIPARYSSPEDEVVIEEVEEYDYDE